MSAHQVKTRVAEGGNAVPDPVIDAPAQAVLPREADGQQRRAGALHQQRAQEDEADKGHDAAQLVVADAVHHHLPLPQAQPPAQQQGEEGGDGHKAQAADLDEGDNDQLAEGGPVGARVPHHQARHAGGGGSGKEGVAEGRAAGSPAGDGQHQQRGAGQYHDEKAQRDDLHTGHLGFSLPVHKQSRLTHSINIDRIPHFLIACNRPVPQAANFAVWPQALSFVRIPPGNR